MPQKSESQAEAEHPGESEHEALMDRLAEEVMNSPHIL